jgi:hypothetical protein
LGELDFQIRNKLKNLLSNEHQYNSINCDNEGDVESTENVISDSTDSDETFFDF